jgi:hypothetical protein
MLLISITQLILSRRVASLGSHSKSSILEKSQSSTHLNGCKQHTKSGTVTLHRYLPISWPTLTSRRIGIQPHCASMTIPASMCGRTSCPGTGHGIKRYVAFLEYHPSNLTAIDRIASMLMTHPQMAACSAQLCWVVTRQRCLSQRARMSTTPCTHL